MKSGWNIHYKYSEVYDTIDIIDYVGYDSIIYGCGALAQK